MMKKITLLLAVLVYGFTLNAQVSYFEDNFVGGDMTQWTTIDADGDGNNWAPATAASMNGECLNSDSWTSALGGLNPDNYLVTAAPIAFPTVADLSLKFRVGALQTNGTFIGDEYSVYLSAANDAASIQAGTLLYNGLLSDVMTADQADGSASFFIHEFDMTAYQGQSLYLTFRHHNTFDMNSVLIGNVLVSSPFSDDLVVNSVVSPATQGSGCQLGTETVTANVTNNGIDPVTSFNATYVITSALSGNLVDSVVETITVAPMALGDNVDFNFATLSSDLSATDSLYNVEIFVSLAGDQDLSSDTVLSTVASISTQAIPYNTSFEIIDGTGTLIPDVLAWGWATEDLNGNNSSFEPQLFAAGSGLTSDGDCALFVEEGNTDWAFSPCLATSMGTTYRVSFQVVTGSYTSGAPVEEIVEVGFGSAANSAAMTIIRQDSLNDNATFSTVVYDFQATGPTTNIGIHKVSGTFILSVDEFSVEVLPAPTANITSAAIDACNGLATLNFDVQTGNDYYINWGDGVTDTTGTSPLTHTYTATGTQNIVLTANNLAGSNSVNGTVDNTLAAPVAAFTVSQAGTTVTTVGFTASNVVSCATYAWDFGDANMEADAASTNNTYAANGTYTVTLTVTNPDGSTNSTTQDVTITGVAINEFNFVDGINVFPNPAKDVLNVAFELSTSQSIELTLVSIDGKIVNTTSLSNVSNVSTTINTSKLSTGMYMLNITSEEGKYTSAVMVK